jgi:MinD superfamily P-loop ATPase
MPVPIIHSLLQWQVYPDREIMIRDAPPGVSCPVVATMLGADFVLLVTEPTPFGLHDLRLAFQLTRELNIPSGVVVNKVGVGDSGVEAFCHAEDLPILMRIPLDRAYGHAIAGGQDLVRAYPEFRPKFEDLFCRIQTILNSTRKDPVRTLIGDSH